VTAGFQLAGSGPEAYERYLVPEFFGPCTEQLLDVAAPAAGERAVDVACGTGVVARRLADRGLSVLGVDVNEGMVAYAAGTDDRVEWRVAEAGSVPADDGTVDLVCCQQGLQFFPDQAGALREAHRVLAAGGRLALAVWRGIEHNAAFGAFVATLDRCAGAEAGAVMRGPLSGPDRDGLRRLLTEAAFTDVRVRIGVLVARFASAREFLEREVVSTPLAGPVGALDPDRQARLAAELERDLAPYTDDDGVALPMQTWLATARRP
jgi:ubiquinone/menaquinone biosynthesis C-methylase UbiE